MSAPVENLITKFHQSSDFAGQQIDLKILDDILKLSFSDNADTARSASAALFSKIIEPLNDSFTCSNRKSYEIIFAHLLRYIRHLDQGKKIDQALTSTGLIREQDMFRRVEKVKKLSRSPFSVNSYPGRIYILSRVTLGADALLTSQVIDATSRIFREAEVILAGNTEKLKELFQGRKELKFQNIFYPRRGNLTDRLNVWADFFDLLNKQNDDYLVIDPDSRISQLGMLPMHQKPENHLLFQGCEDNDSSGPVPLCEKMKNWLQTLFPEKSLHDLSPHLSPGASGIDAAETIIKSLKTDERKIIVMNFGVGGNIKKRIGPGFESSLVQTLSGRGFRIIFDLGAAEEMEEFRALLKSINPELPIIEGLDVSFAKKGCDSNIYAFQGNTGELAAMIKASDAYIGYDSMGQHLAAALRKPLIVVFTGYQSDIFRIKWTPCSPAPVHILAVPDKTEWTDDRLVEEVIRRLEKPGFQSS